MAIEQIMHTCVAEIFVPSIALGTADEQYSGTDWVRFWICSAHPHQTEIRISEDKVTWSLMLTDFLALRH